LIGRRGCAEFVHFPPQTKSTGVSKEQRGLFPVVALRVQHEPLGRKIGADSNDFDCFWGAVGLSGGRNGEGAIDRPGLAGNPV
jgi:hypothetical protein